MTKKVLVVEPESTLEKAMAMMSQKHIRHLPVFESDDMIGLISIGDVLQKIIDEQKFAIHELQNYIEGTGYCGSIIEPE